MNPKQKMFHQRLVKYLVKNGLTEKDALAAANSSVQTLREQGNGFKITDVPKMGKWLLKERAAYDKENPVEDGTMVYDLESKSLFEK